MILPMKKISLAVMDKHREESLIKLRKLGVVHLENRNVSSDNLSGLLERKAKIENALGILRSYKPPRGGGDQWAAVSDQKSRRPIADVNHLFDNFNFEFTGETGIHDQSDLVDMVLKYAEEQKNLQDRAGILAREKSRIEEWGDFNPRDFSLLAEKGLNLFLYKLNLKSFAAMPGDTRHIILGKDKHSVYAVVVDKEVPGEVPFAIGEHSIGEINGFTAEIRKGLENIERLLASLAKRKSVLEEEKEILIKKIEFETARAGMDVLEDTPRDFSVAWITGFVPQDDLELLRREASENGWALAAVDPGPDDMTPTKLRNNRFARLLNPLTEFLDVVPGYNEVDISGWFLFFFTIFFGMIFGDAAYGAIFVIIAVAGIFMTLKKGVPTALKLLLLLGSSNFIWGALTCTWFGVDVEYIPQALQRLSLPLISNVTAAKSSYDEGIVRQNIMIFCFSLALLQLSIGHIVAIIRSRTLKVLADLGSIGMLAGMYGIVLSLIASNQYRQIPLLTPCVYLLGGGFVLNFVFAGYQGSVGKSVVDGFKNFISVFLGIANVFSDIMSYIRLWAVGLAGAAISSTVDTIAGPMLGHFFFFVFGMVILVFGHGLNLILNALSVLVHGVRLNTLEFSAHAGLTWAGTAYKPFAEK